MKIEITDEMADKYVSLNADWHRANKNPDFPSWPDEISEEFRVYLRDLAKVELDIAFRVFNSVFVPETGIDKMSDHFALPLTPVYGRMLYDARRLPMLRVLPSRAEAVALAINCHDDLLAALKHARGQIQHPDQVIDEAIAKAEGK